MNNLRVKKRSFNISIFNIKISPKEKNKDFTELYSSTFKKLHSENIAIRTRGDKYMELRTLYESEKKEVLYGNIIYYTILDGKDWYNKNTKLIEEKEVADGLYPNAKEIEYFFIPEAHRFCFISKSNGIAMSQIEIFLKEALPKVVDNTKVILVTKELKSDIIEKILSAERLTRLDVGISYSNNDLSDEFEELLDNDLRDGQIKDFSISAKSFKSSTLDLQNSKMLKAAVKLSQSNGYAEATIIDKLGKSENIATIEYPRKDLIKTIVGNEFNDVLKKVLSIFRDDKKN
jgi:hypothetical protein